MEAWKKDYIRALRLLAWGAVLVVLALNIALPYHGWMVMG